MHENPEPDFYVSLNVSLPDKYPDIPPSIELNGFPDTIPNESIQDIITKLEEQAKSMPGYQVLITLVTEVQYSVPLLIRQLEKQKEENAERLRLEKEEAEQRRFEGRFRLSALIDCLFLRKSCHGRVFQQMARNI
jgi:hypothetical protein